MSIGNIDPWIFAFSAVTVIVTIWMGFRSAKTSKTASDFFVAGRSVSVGWNASAISGEYLSAASFMGVAGMVMSSGYDALWYPVCYACGYLFLLLFIAGPLRRFGAYTIPDFAEGRFDSPLFRKIAVVFVLFIGFFYTMPQMKGAGTTLSYIFPGLPYWAGVVLVGAVITLNVALGGMKGITLIQAFQYWAKMFAISVPIFVLMAVYGNYNEQIRLNSTDPWAAPLLPSTDEPVIKANQVFYSVSSKPATPPPLLRQLLSRVLPYKAGEVFTGTNCNVVRVVQAYARYRVGGYSGEWSIHIARSLVNPEMGMEWNDNRLKTIPLSPKLSGRAYGKYLRDLLATNGISIVHVGSSGVKAFPTDRADYFLKSPIPPGPDTLAFDFSASERKAMPEKAPVDSTWLNPFGPLTTKAASAAKLSPEESRPYSLLYTYSLIIALVCGTAGLPHILVRFYTNPDGVAAKRTTMWVMILIGIFYVFPPIFGVLGRNLLPELYSGVGAKGTDKIVLELPRILNERYGVLGSVLSGITCAGAFAAFMSTFSGLLVSMTGAMAHDVYGRMLNPKATPNQRLRAFKIAAVAIGLVAILLGMQVEPLEINFMVGQAFAIAAASYFPLLFMAVWWRGLTMKGAATGMLTGGLSALVGISLTSFSTLAVAPGKTGELFAMFKPLNDFWATHPLLRIICEQPAIWAVPLAMVLMIVVSKMTRRDVPQDIRMKMLVLHAPEKLGLKQEYIQEHQPRDH